MSDVARTSIPDSSDVVGVVLAAGAGTRYGMPKILAHEGAWLDSAVTALRDGGCDRVVVAMGAAKVVPPAGAEVLLVEEWEAGIGATVSAVLRWARRQRHAAGLVLQVVDTPDVGAGAVARVVDAAGARRDALVRAVFDGRPGHPVYLGADHFGPALDVIGGDVGAQVYLRGRAVSLVECGDLASGEDIDVRE
ncbi:NTP transferase domain-containing protein [Gordonia sp. zg691]|uniref:NTP transferase domain-containing protein n=1 Tax=Gordonia jinghuaiqii TaxID=2758710 RepID=A0A7D7R4W3_9ACTN|nr:NTP transferase domain-containing protein [Gordonia jinghuaiqii]MBD0863787.1 NTP transferase domain-containing protein [Gordonia jinghuaiqii]MCR5979992.1 NTP transferase domain-containing protein [Gordonia jinghuaiqii]QMT03187.1 NTP transferase domain-containing protein [Gordonia jinghuaiqii]